MTCVKNVCKIEFPLFVQTIFVRFSKQYCFEVIARAFRADYSATCSCATGNITSIKKFSCSVSPICGCSINICESFTDRLRWRSRCVRNIERI